MELPSADLLSYTLNAMGTFFSTRHLCLLPKWPTMMEITAV